MAAFLILEGRDAGRVIPLTSLPFNIGRQIESELVLADPQVSRQHARVEKTASGFVVMDLKSRNGIYVNDRKVERHPLTVGDRLKIGGTVLVFQTDADAARKVMADSIPDSADFHLHSSSSAVSYEEPTAIRHISELESSDPKAHSRSIAQVAKLFYSGLPPQGTAAQLLDIFFQVFLPDRSQVRWLDTDPISFARSRSEGKKCPTFDIPEELLDKASRGAIGVTADVPVPTGKGLEKRSVLLAPLLASGAVRGWLYGDRPKEQGSFSARDLEYFDTFSVVASGVIERSTVLFENRRLKETVAMMEKHISPQVVKMLSAKGISLEESDLHVKQREVTVLFSDIQGFTPLSERLPPEELAHLLNEYFQRMVDVIMAHHGTLNKFIGDAVMALFGAPENHGNDAANAVNAGLDMIEALKKFWTEIDDRKRFNIRVGINTGTVVAGNIGSQKKMEYTVLGDAVNVASRLEGLSPPNTVTIGALTAERVGGLFQLEKFSSVKVKGKSIEIDVFRVLGPTKRA